MIPVSKNLGVGIVGLGWSGNMHMKAFSEVNGAEVTALYSQNNLEQNKIEEKHQANIKRIEI